MGDIKSHDDAHVEKAISHVDDSAALDDKAQAAMYKAQAVDAENAEHDMGVLDAVKQYPMAAWWAFVMSCTIVRRTSFLINEDLQLTSCSDYGGLLCFPYGKFHRLTCVRRRLRRL
jgi:SP family general alpha glucoside:H+ symporter-like MFS transporter